MRNVSADTCVFAGGKSRIRRRRIARSAYTYPWLVAGMKEREADGTVSREIAKYCAEYRATVGSIRE